jgi:hypothetical protein
VSTTTPSNNKVFYAGGQTTTIKVAHANGTCGIDMKTAIARSGAIGYVGQTSEYIVA